MAQESTENSVNRSLKIAENCEIQLPNRDLHKKQIVGEREENLEMLLLNQPNCKT